MDDPAGVASFTGSPARCSALGLKLAPGCCWIGAGQVRIVPGRQMALFEARRATRVCAVASGANSVSTSPDIQTAAA